MFLGKKCNGVILNVIVIPSAFQLRRKTKASINSRIKTIGRIVTLNPQSDCLKYTFPGFCYGRFVQGVQLKLKFVS